MEAAEQNYKETMESIKVMERFIAEWLEMFLTYLAIKDQYAPNKALADWIKKGGEIYAYTPRGKVLGELKYNLEKEGIAFVSMSDGRIMVAEKDIPKVREINRSLNVAHCNYYQEVNLTEMEDAIAKFMENKQIVTIENVDTYFREVLKNKCNDITKGFMVGASSTDGKENLSVLGTTVYTPGEKKDFCKAYLEANLSLYGRNNEKKTKQIDADLLISEEIKKTKLFDQPDQTVYIIGEEGSIKHVLELNNQELLFKQVVYKDGKFNEKLLERCEKTDPSYEEIRQKCADQIQNKIPIYGDIDLVYEHLASSKRVVESDRPEKNREEYYVSMYYDKVADKVDSMIRGKIAANEIYSKQPAEIFEFYRTETIKILEAISKEEYVNGYKHEDMDEIKEYYTTVIAANAEIINDRNPEPINVTREELNGWYKEVTKHMADDRITQHTARTQNEKEVKEAIRTNGNQDNR